MNVCVALSLLVAVLGVLPSLTHGSSGIEDSTHSLRRLQVQPTPATDKCYRECPAIVKPVCGTDGATTTTYDNKCLFRVAKCKRSGALKLVAKKACPTDRAFCSGIFCAATQRCITQSDGVSRSFSYCADLCDPSNCSEQEQCVKRQVACFNPPCLEQMSCVPKVAPA